MQIHIPPREYYFLLNQKIALFISLIISWWYNPQYDWFPHLTEFSYLCSTVQVTDDAEGCTIKNNNIVGHTNKQKITTILFCTFINIFTKQCIK